MAANPRSPGTLLSFGGRGRPHGQLGSFFSGGAATVVFALIAVFALVPASPPAESVRPDPGSAAEVQTLVVPKNVAAPEVERQTFSITPGRDTFVSSGTNYDWAKLVLLNGGWPVSDNNVTVIVRWMRQENYIDSWWNRNNPLNNGWGSGGGGGTGTYPSLESAAVNAAEALNSHPGYAAIRSAFTASAATEVTEQAIWTSPWASGHYANGAHWHYSAVPTVKAPAGAW